MPEEQPLRIIRRKKTPKKAPGKKKKGKAQPQSKTIKRKRKTEQAAELPQKKQKSVPKNSELSEKKEVDKPHEALKMLRDIMGRKKSAEAVAALNDFYSKNDFTKFEIMYAMIHCGGKNAAGAPLNAFEQACAAFPEDGIVQESLLRWVITAGQFATVIRTFLSENVALSLLMEAIKNDKEDLAQQLNTLLFQSDQQDFVKKDLWQIALDKLQQKSILIASSNQVKNKYVLPLKLIDEPSQNPVPQQNLGAPASDVSIRESKGEGDSASAALAASDESDIDQLPAVIPAPERKELQVESEESDMDEVPEPSVQLPRQIETIEVLDSDENSSDMDEDPRNPASSVLASEVPSQKVASREVIEISDDEQEEIEPQDNKSKKDTLNQGSQLSVLSLDSPPHLPGVGGKSQEQPLTPFYRPDDENRFDSRDAFYSSSDPLNSSSSSSTFSAVTSSLNPRPSQPSNVYSSGSLPLASRSMGGTKLSGNFFDQKQMPNEKSANVTRVQKAWFLVSSYEGNDPRMNLSLHTKNIKIIQSYQKRDGGKNLTSKEQLTLEEIITLYESLVTQDNINAAGRGRFPL